MCLSTESFDHSTARTSIFQLSNALGSESLDAYVGLIANQKLQTELYVLSFLLKNRVYPGDLWELVGERSIEAKQEETLRRHQSICANGHAGRHAAVERILLDERKRRCQMEVSLYTQAIEVLEQHWLSRFGARSKHFIRPPLRQMIAPMDHLPLPCTLLACSISASISSCTGPSLPLSSTWVTADVQKSFYESFKQELTIRAELMVTSLATRCSNAYLHNLGLDLLILQAKRRRAHTEIALYTMAINNLCQYKFMDTMHHRPDDENSEDDAEESCGDYEDYEDDEDYNSEDCKNLNMQ
ncbi:hypothetical protein EV702DRAFT_1048337 [Suillus placidus]|uniref:Uncharacterized protein n=1 Tax=Suillus placidus TaxID=48579 RepID=A0A9P6ZN31_9AGAM|nr:hypothetical protein EV702DRAFT_1048337 [Suillus placidus]